MGAFAAIAISAGVLAGSFANPVPAQCLRALSPLSESSIPLSSAFDLVVCPAGKAARPFHYDTAQRVTRLTRPISVGDIVAMFPEFGTKMVRPGDVLELLGASGAVRIERDVEALQGASPGQRLFVKSGDGEILSVRYEDVVP
jgi:hypothetical protein